jgi:asparagine synthase (glutamine-hydrolysing)
MQWLTQSTKYDNKAHFKSKALSLMCGIVGYVGNIETERLQSASDALTHRGPDDAGIWQSSTSSVGLAHRRLAILDLSPLGHQPMVSSDGSVVLVFNGEIYNFSELRDELTAKGVVFNGHSDTEVLLNLYITVGQTMLSRLNGIFAFAIWDVRSQELFVARDAFGVKPLYYCNENREFVFASEIKALQPLIEVATDLDEKSLQQYLSFLWCPGEGTPFRAVRKLGPGEALIVCAGQIKKHWKWYELPLHRPRLAVPMSARSAIEGSASHLRAAVHRQLIADVPVGAFLSGGLDSSAVVAFAREQKPDIRCFTIDTGGQKEAGSMEDLPYARRVAQHLGVSLDVVHVDAQRMASDLEMMVYQLDEPLADPAPLNVLYISQLAREHGIKVLLSGAGGDDLFTGYRRHRAVIAERWWYWLPLSVRRLLASGSVLADQRTTIGRRLAKVFSGAALGSDERLVHYFRWINRGDLANLYSDEFKAAVGKSQAEESMLAFLSSLPQDTSRLGRMLALEQRFFLTDHNLTYTDKMSMAAGVEVRVPFLDLDLVDFAAQVPDKFKQRGKEGKWVLKKAMEPYLPQDVIYRSKTGFGVPLRHWMRYELRELLGDLLSLDSLRHRGLFNPESVQQLIVDNDAGRIDASYTLLSLLCIEIWCRRFVDSRYSFTNTQTR